MSVAYIYKIDNYFTRANKLIKYYDENNDLESIFQLYA